MVRFLDHFHPDPLGPTPRPWAPAGVVGRPTTAPGTHAARPASREPYPYGLYRAAVAGLAPEGRPEATAPEFEGRYWH